MKDLTSRKAVDLIIIGNNLGAGVPKATAVADDMKERVIIVWNSYIPGNGSARYSTLRIQTRP